ncbi:MAG: cation diffusion facilitator family transporter [Planctomycetota bacterium]
MLRDPTGRKKAVALLSIASNATLVGLKIVVGLAVGSVAILSEAIHSGLDLVAAIIAFVAVRESGKAPDREHPFGHGKAENISGTIEALLIFAAAAWIIYEAVRRILRPEHLEMLGWGVGVMLVSTLVNIAVSRRLFRIAKETESIALEADAWHLRTDVWTSAGVMAGMGILWIAEGNLPPESQVHWIDPVAALVVAALILRAAWELTVKSARDLMDQGLPDDELAWLRELIGRHAPVVRGFHWLRTRRAGAIRFVEFHMLVDGRMSVADSHRITDEITRDVRARFETANVLIHIEPCDNRCGPDCDRGCLLSGPDREAAFRKIHDREPAEG